LHGWKEYFSVHNRLGAIVEGFSESHVTGNIHNFQSFKKQSNVLSFMSVHLKKRELIIKGGRNRKPRPKTFKSEEAAHAFAKSNNLKEYSLKHLTSGAAIQKKIRIISA